AGAGARGRRGAFDLDGRDRDLWMHAGGHGGEPAHDHPRDLGRHRGGAVDGRAPRRARRRRMREPIAAPRTVRLMTALLLVGTFALGTVTGTGLAYWTAGVFRPPPPGPLPLRLLDLSPTQTEQA